MLDELIDFAAAVVAGVGGYGTGWFDVWIEILIGDVLVGDISIVQELFVCVCEFERTE